VASTADSEFELVRRYFAALSRGDIDAAQVLAEDDAVIDVRNSHAPWSGLYRGDDANRAAFRQLTEPWDELQWELGEVASVPGRRLLCGTRIRGRGSGSGIEVDAHGAWLITIRDGLLTDATLFQTLNEGWRAARRRAFADARLYFVCEARPRGEDPARLLDAALRGGVDVIQLRDKDLPREALADAATPFRAAAAAHRALFILNDEPDLVAAVGADGVHVGQDDAPVAEARRAAGADRVVGLSTHSAAQFDAARDATRDARPDQVSVGPVWETPTKRGRPAAGLELISHAAERGGDLPWFAIGGIDAGNVADVVSAGARRIVVVRAIRDAPDPEASARELRAALEAAG
jgi:thiamine-phosphate pyrophosphorylase